MIIIEESYLQTFLHRPSVCGCHCGMDEVYYMDDRTLCYDCLDELTTFCEECGTRIFRAECVTGEHTLCVHCFDDYYTHCEECGRVIHQDNVHYDAQDRILCDHCIENGSIYHYSYKPKPIFYGDTDNLFLGIELELDDGGCYRSNSKILTQIANEKRYQNLYQNRWLFRGRF